MPGISYWQHDHDSPRPVHCVGPRRWCLRMSLVQLEGSGIHRRQQAVLWAVFKVLTDWRNCCFHSRPPAVMLKATQNKNTTCMQHRLHQQPKLSPPVQSIPATRTDKVFSKPLARGSTKRKDDKATRKDGTSFRRFKKRKVRKRKVVLKKLRYCARSRN